MLETAEVELRFDRVWRFDKHHAAWLKWLDVLMSISSPTRRSSRATHENRGDTISVPGAGETQWWGAGEVFFRVTACRTLFLFVAGQQVLQTEWTTMNRWCHESMNMMNLLVCFFNACYIYVCWFCWIFNNLRLRRKIATEGQFPWSEVRSSNRSIFAGLSDLQPGWTAGAGFAAGFDPGCEALYSISILGYTSDYHRLWLYMIITYYNIL